MSPSRGTKGETKWSSCSANALRSGNPNLLYGLQCLEEDSGKPAEHLDLEAGVYPGCVRFKVLNILISYIYRRGLVWDKTMSNIFA